MGKRLVINGADFSENGIYEPIINWYNNGSKYSPIVSFTPETSPAGAGIIITDKPINIVRVFLLNSITAGTSVKVYLGAAGNTYTGSEPALANYTITSADIENGYCDIILGSKVTLSSNQALMISAGVIAYGSGAQSSDIIPYIRSNSSGLMNSASSVFICMQCGKIEQ